MADFYPKRIGIVIPVYNHAATLEKVVRGVLAAAPGSLVLVVDDGSTDWPPELPETLSGLGVRLERFKRNRGKGAALLHAARIFHAARMDCMIALDADGQHDPGDLPKFFAVLQAHRDNDILAVGVRNFNVPNVPAASRFGRRFSNFWFRLETGTECADTQSGFRAYPVAALIRMKPLARRYGFEAETLTRGVWGGLSVVHVPIHVYYPVPGERVSHFHKFKDNFRLSLLHAHLIGVRLLPFPQPNLTGRARRHLRLWPLLRHPGAFFRMLLAENSTPKGLALSAAAGTYLAVLPLLGFHIVAILYVTARFKLNKVMALAIQHLFMPPLSPFLCIELGYFLTHGRFWTELTLRSVTSELPLRLYEWLLGSLLLAPVFAAITGGMTLAVASAVRKRWRTHG